MESCEEAGCSLELAVTGAVSSSLFSVCDDASAVQSVCYVVDGCISGNRSVCPSICHATRMEEDPEVTLDIQCLWQGGRVALTLTNNYFLHRRGSGGARAITV